MGLPRDIRSKTKSQARTRSAANVDHEQELKTILQICKSVQKLTQNMCKVIFEVMVERECAQDVSAANAGSEAVKDSEPNRGTERSVQEAEAAAQSQHNAEEESQQNAEEKTPQHTEEDSHQHTEDESHQEAARMSERESESNSSLSSVKKRSIESSANEVPAKRVKMRQVKTSSEYFSEENVAESEANSSFPSVKKRSSESSADEVPAKRVKFRQAKTSSEDFSEEKLAEVTTTSDTTVVVSTESE